MNRKGVLYDVGRVMGGNFRPAYDPKIIHYELSIIKNDLHCNAVKICGLSITRLMKAAEDALSQGLEVWLSPEMWNKRPEKTLSYLVKAATAAESLRERWPERVVFSVGTEVTFFLQGFLEGRTLARRVSHPSLRERVKVGTSNQLLNAYLRDAAEAVRAVFHGSVTYSSLSRQECTKVKSKLFQDSSIC